MNERQARLIAARIEARWPGIIQSSVRSTAQRGWDAKKCEVVLRIPRENRVLHLRSSGAIAGMLDVCATLIEQQPISLCSPKERKKQPMEPMNEQEIRDGQQDLLNEEEAATYLDVKVSTLRTYVNQGIVAGQLGGLFSRPDLDAYKSRRRPRGIPADPVPAPSPSAVLPDSSPVPAPSPTSTIETSRAVVVPATAAPEAVGVAPACEPTDAGEIQVLHDLINMLKTIPGVLGLGRLMEVPRSWKMDVTTVRGPESYRLIRNADGSFRQEPWDL